MKKRVLGLFAVAMFSASLFLITKAEARYDEVAGMQCDTRNKTKCIIKAGGAVGYSTGRLVVQ